MNQYQVHAVVLARRNLGEADRIITFLTREQGVIRAKARGVRKIRSRLAGSLEPMTAIELRLVHGKSLDTVIGARAKTIFRLDQVGLDAVRCGLLITEMAERLLPEHQPHPNVYELLLESYAGLAAGWSPIVVQHHFSFHLLADLGYLPDTEQVVSARYFDIEHGTFSDEPHGSMSQAISPQLLKLWRFMNLASLAQLTRVRQADWLVTEAQALIDQFYQYRFDIEFKTQKLL